jgi:hypothetical protein
MLCHTVGRMNVTTPKGWGCKSLSIRGDGHHLNHKVNRDMNVWCSMEEDGWCLVDMLLEKKPSGVWMAKYGCKVWPSSMDEEFG